jgi:preprotein translocase subunit SecE
MARDRQRSKARQRQQQRRDERLSSGTNARPDAPSKPEPETTDPELEQEVDRMLGAPVHDLGTSGRTTSEALPEPSFETDDETLFEDEPAGGDGGGSDGGGAAVATGPRGHRGGPEGAAEHKRGRLVAFLVAVWAELQRVQWPDRRQLTQLTGVVLFFVLIVGAYLGGLDAVFSKLIQQIL